MGTMPPGLASYMASKKKGAVDPNIQAAAANRVQQAANKLTPISDLPKKGKKFAPKPKVAAAAMKEDTDRDGK